MSAETLHLPLGADSYDILIGRNLIEHAGRWLKPAMASHKCIVIADEEIASPYLAQMMASLDEYGFKAESLILPSGEATKSFAQFESLANNLLAMGVDRQTTLIALGGGVIGDLVGFVASVIMRGIPFIQVPTTLLAQVDSSVGGKTGINTEVGKNMIGSFYQPKRVLIDTNTLETLPSRQIRAGYAEIVKYAALGDIYFFEWLEANGAKLLEGHALSLSHAIKICCSMKGQIVEWDEKENNMRALLNLGHTFGHALEAETGYDGSIAHGESVSIGMVMAARLSRHLNMCDASVEERLSAHLRALNLPTTPSDIEGVNWNAVGIASHFASDKKAHDGSLAFVCLRSLGDAELVRGVSPQIATQVVQEFL